MKVKVADIKVGDRVRNSVGDVSDLMKGIKRTNAAFVVVWVDKDFNLIGGARRLAAMKALGYEEVEALIGDVDPMLKMELELEENIIRSDFTEEEKVRGVLAIHKMHKAANPGWRIEDTAAKLNYSISSIGQMKLLAEALEEGKASTRVQEVLKKQGSVAAYKEMCLEKQREVEAFIVEQQVKEMEKIKTLDGEAINKTADSMIRLGDCIDLIPQLADKSIDFIHTDPPYAIDFDKLEKGATKNEMYTNDTMEASTKTWSFLAPHFFRVLKDNAFAFIWLSFKEDKHSMVSQVEMIKSKMQAAGFTSQSVPFVWVKLDSAWAAYAPSLWLASACDFGLVFAKGNPVLKRMGSPNFTLAKALSGEEKHHPLQRPTELTQDVISRFASVGDVVLDPFGGSCSTAFGALALGCKPICFERDPAFYNVSKQKILDMLCHC